MIHESNPVVPEVCYGMKDLWKCEGVMDGEDGKDELTSAWRGELWQYW